MRVVICGFHPEEIRPLAEEVGFEVVESDPDVAISHGGDGTLLGAERDWPGTPKVAIRPTRVAKKCKRHQDLDILRLVYEGKAPSTPLLKLEGIKDDRTVLGVNDIIIHNADVSSAVRYRVKINGIPYSGEIIGDGLIVSTPFGSTAYYRSVTHSFFRVGIGLAFNNCTERVSHLVLREDSEIEVTVTRGPAELAADNDPYRIRLEDGDRVSIRKNDGQAHILCIDTILCPDCLRISREPYQISSRVPFL